MKAIRISQTGGPEVLEYVDVDLAPPGAGEVRVRHTVIGVNFIDTYHRSGLYKLPLPTGIGSEAAGVVEAAGPGVTGVVLGDRVAYVGAMGAYAEANNVRADRLVKIPPGVSDETAAAALLKGMTAQYLLKRTHQVKSGETILFHSAAGGVGLIAGQWAKHLGAIVIGTVGHNDKIALAKANGYARVLNTRSEDWVKRLRELTGGQGVPVVYDSIGKDTFMKSLDCVRPLGLMVSFGQSSGSAGSFDPGILAAKGSLFFTRPSLGAYTAKREDLLATAKDLFDVVSKGIVKIHVNQRYPLKDAAKAHSDLQSRKTTGSTVLTV